MNSIIQRLKITKNVLYVLVLQFLSLSKNAWTVCSFKKHCIWIGNHYRHLMMSPHRTDISLPKNETVESGHVKNLLNCWCYSDRKLGYWRYSLMRFTKPGVFSWIIFPLATDSHPKMLSQTLAIAEIVPVFISPETLLSHYLGLLLTPLIQIDTAKPNSVCCWQC
jgi:hypothetical protein